MRPLARRHPTGPTSFAHPGRPRWRRAATVVAALALLATGAACEPGAVSFRFAPAVGDEFRFRSEVTTTVERSLDDVPETVVSEAVLDATETVVATDADGIRVSVTIVRDGTTPRTFEVNLDRASRLREIDLVEGVPAEALGLDIGAGLPADVASPPPGPLEPGRRWTIETSYVPAGRDQSVPVTGRGQVTGLGVEDGFEVVTTEVEVSVPVTSVVETSTGRVTLEGVQTTTSRTTYDLLDGALRRDRTTIEGSVTLVADPPPGVDATPVQGTLDYVVEATTTRVTD